MWRSPNRCEPDETHRQSPRDFLAVAAGFLLRAYGLEAGGFDNARCSAAIRAAFSRLNRSTVRRTSIPFLYCQINSANTGGPIAKTISSVRRR